MTRRWPRRGLLLAGAAILALLAGACIDYAVTSSSLPDFDPSFEFDASNPTRKDPADLERSQLIDGYGARVWLYALGIVAVLAALVAAAVRRTPRNRRRELFTDLGVAGVVSAIVSTVLSLWPPDLITSSNQGSVLWVPAALLLVGAAVGSVINGPSDPGLDPPRVPPEALRSQEPRGGGASLYVNWAALLLAAVTVLLTVIGLGQRECGIEAPGWSDSLLVASLFVGLAAALCGIVALLARRWVTALLSIPAPLLAFFGLVAAACLS